MAALRIFIAKHEAQDRDGAGRQRHQVRAAIDLAMHRALHLRGRYCPQSAFQVDFGQFHLPDVAGRWNNKADSSSAARVSDWPSYVADAH